MSVLLGLLGLACMGYGVTVMTLNTGSLFFAVWYALGAALLGGAAVVRLGLWRLLPTLVLRLGAGVLGCLLVLLVGTAGLVAGQMHAQGVPGLDYIVVLGAQVRSDGSPSPVLRYRLETALAYLQENPQTQVIVSGGQGPNEACAEAEGMAAWLQAQGVAPERIVQETRSLNTQQNVAFSRELMSSPASPVGIVTNNFHVCRALLLARKAGLTSAYGIAAYSTPWYLPNNVLRECMGLVKDVVVGNI